MLELEYKRFSSPRGDIAYWIYKNPNPSAHWIFFLHGLTADHTLFDLQVPFFANQYNVIVWDAPAHALSRPYSDFSYANCADDLRELLLSEGIPKAILVGQSMGGYIIQAFLLRYPEMTQAFVAIDTCPFGKAYYSTSDLFWLRQIGWMCRLYPHQYLVDSISKSVAVTQPTQDNMQKALSFYSHRALCDLMGTGYRCFVQENQDLHIACPVLILVGEHDKTGKVMAYCKAWQNATGYPLQIIQNAAHNANYDNPDAVNTLIDAFLLRILTDIQTA